MQLSSKVKSVAVATTTSTDIHASVGVPVGKKSKIGKLTFRLSPLRKVAKTAKLNLNRYWGFFGQLYGSAESGSRISSKKATAATATAFSEEMEENRRNEILEAESNASSQNSLNIQFEDDLMSYRSNPASSFLELPPLRGLVRRRCCSAHDYDTDSLYSSYSSSLDSLQNEMDIVIMGSSESFVSHENSFNM